jgi:hypothetical protein
MNELTLWLHNLNLTLRIIRTISAHLHLFLQHFGLDRLAHLGHVDSSRGVRCLSYKLRSNGKLFIKILATDPCTSKKKVPVSRHRMRVQNRCLNPDLVFEVIELDGTVPQALERAWRISDLPFGPGGAIQNSEYRRINIVL